MLPGVDGKEHICVEQKLRGRLNRPYVIDGYALTVKISIGSATYPIDGKNDDELIHRADVAMYHEKANGRSELR